MTTTLESESTLTDRYQTTVPETVHRALKLGKRDKIHYSIRPDGAVVMSRVSQTRRGRPGYSTVFGLFDRRPCQTA